MKNFLLLILSLCFSVVQAQTLTQTLYFDFGSITTNQGHITEGADPNGHYWNNITNNTAGNKYAAVGTVYSPLVNAGNAETGYVLTLDSRFSTNGLSGGGGLLNPSADHLGDLAVATATEDYFFIESNENNSSFTISNLNPDHGYKFYAFGSRNATDVRTAYYTMSGYNHFRGELQIAGANCGGTGINQNISNICESDLIYPAEDGTIQFIVSRMTGAYIALNALKIEEYNDVTKPQPAVEYTALSLTGSATEEGEDIPMRMVSVDGTKSKVFELYTSLKEGTFSLKALTSENETVTFGASDATNGLAVDGNAIAATPGEAYITVDLDKHTYSIVPIEEWGLVGSVTPGGWDASKGVAISYQGSSVWGGKVELSRVSTISDRERFIFVMNKSWDYQMKRIKGTANEVGLASQGYDIEDIYINHGTYHVTLDLRNYVYYIDCGDGVDPYKISMMGSSVANGQGATGNQGYAAMYGEMLENRFSGQVSASPWFMSGISINGNNTLNLLARYNDLIHDCGEYVIFGLSLGNEGIHGAADQQAVFDQFRNNMQTLIRKAREDGKYPLITNSYTRGDFTDADYGYIKQMNLLIHEWDLPSVNLLGAIDNGSGKWADGYQVEGDIYHPTTDGHREFFYAMVPSLFDAIKAGKALPERIAGTSYTLKNASTLEFTPENTVHPFTISFKVKGNEAGVIASFTNADAEGKLRIGNAGEVIYQSPLTGEVQGTVNVTDGEWHTVSLAHYYAQGRTLLYVDKVLQGELAEKLTAGTFTLGDKTSNAERQYSELFFYRSAMNLEEVTHLHEGCMLKSSLEIYAPLDDTKPVIDNLAQSMNTVTLHASPTGIASEQLADVLTVEGLKGGIAIDSLYEVPVKIYTGEGHLVYNASVIGHETVGNLATGVYLVNGMKVLVK